jgi:hypothetical protein
MWGQVGSGLWRKAGQTYDIAILLNSFVILSKPRRGDATMQSTVATVSGSRFVIRRAKLGLLIKTPPQISDSNEITCHDFCPHFSHFLLQCVLPAFLPRIPPRSHNELLCPHLQCTLHARESFSIALTQLFGKTAETNFWMKLIARIL